MNSYSLTSRSSWKRIATTHASRVALIIFVFALYALIFPSKSKADYLVTGKIMGTECTNYAVFKSCSGGKSVDAVKGKDGKLYHLPNRFAEVSEYNGRNCFIRLESMFGGAVGWLSEAMTNATFYERQSNGSYKELDLGYIRFRCRKIN